MDDMRLGAAMRALRIRRRLRQADLALRAGVSRTTISRLENGDLDGLTMATLRKVARELDARFDFALRWHGGGDLDRLVNARHSALHEAFAQTFGSTVGWVFSPEVSFSIFGERGIIDILGWHAATRSLLVIELKSELVDVQEHLGTLDRKIRLAPKIASERGWRAATTGAWLLLAEGRTNRRRLEMHRAFLRSALPDDGRRASAWLRSPSGSLRALSQMSYAHQEVLSLRLATPKRVRLGRTGGLAATASARRARPR